MLLSKILPDCFLELFVYECTGILTWLLSCTIDSWSQERSILTPNFESEVKNGGCIFSVHRIEIFHTSYSCCPNLCLAHLQWIPLVYMPAVILKRHHCAHLAVVLITSKVRWSAKKCVTSLPSVVQCAFFLGPLSKWPYDTCWIRQR